MSITKSLSQKVIREKKPSTVSCHTFTLHADLVREFLSSTRNSALCESNVIESLKNCSKMCCRRMNFFRCVLFWKEKMIPLYFLSVKILVDHKISLTESHQGEKAIHNILSYVYAACRLSQCLLHNIFGQIDVFLNPATFFTEYKNMFKSQINRY